jgi:hypothetical protein
MGPAPSRNLSPLRSLPKLLFGFPDRYRLYLDVSDAAERLWLLTERIWEASTRF